MTKKSSQKRGVHNCPVKASTGRYARLAQTPVNLRTAGQELLRQAVDSEGFSLRQLEQITGLSKSTCSALLLGTRRPSEQAAEGLSRLFGVPEEAWHRSPGWRPSNWAPRDTCELSVLSPWSWAVGLLVPSPLSWARLAREQASLPKSRPSPPTLESATASVWSIVGPELARVPQVIKTRLGLPVGGQAPADTLLTLLNGLLRVACSNDFDGTYDALADAGAIQMISFLNDLANEVSDVPGAAQ